MGASIPKQFLPLGGKPILTRTLHALAGVAEITEIMVVVDEFDRERCRRDVLEPHRVDKVRCVLAGGALRQDSVEQALREVDGRADLVLVHDGVRPLVTPAIIATAIRVAGECGAAIVAIPVRDTVKRAAEQGVVGTTVDRDGLWAVQTPQVFRREWIIEAYRRAREEGFTGTDDASLVERCGRRVHLVEGSPENIKVTSPEDLVMAEAILRERGA